jgi:hypothetical protein
MEIPEKHQHVEVAFCFFTGVHASFKYFLPALNIDIYYYDIHEA